MAIRAAFLYQITTSTVICSFSMDWLVSDIWLWNNVHVLLSLSIVSTISKLFWNTKSLPLVTSKSLICHFLLYNHFSIYLFFQITLKNSSFEINKWSVWYLNFDPFISFFFLVKTHSYLYIEPCYFERSFASRIHPRIKCHRLSKCTLPVIMQLLLSSSLYVLYMGWRKRIKSTHWFCWMVRSSFFGWLKRWIMNCFLYFNLKKTDAWLNLLDKYVHLCPIKK